MKSFREYLKESYLTFQDALNLFGLRNASDYKELDKTSLRNLYKKLAIANHPDKGGSVSMMQKINTAYDMLQKGTGEISQKDQEIDREEKAKLYAGISINSIKSNFRLNAFREYFEEIFGERFDAEFNITDASKINRFSSYVGASCDFYNQDRTTVLHVTYTISFTQLYSAETKLGDADTDLSVYAHTEILYNRKKLTLIKNRYAYDSNYTIMKDPSKLFPRDKLKSQIKKINNTVNKTLKKRDAVLILEHELGAKISYRGDQIWATIPFPLPNGSTANFQIYRVTWAGVGTWQVSSGIEVTIPSDNLLGKKRESFVPTNIVGGSTIIETQEVFDIIIRGVKSIRGNCTSGEDVAKGVKRMIEDYMAQFRAGKFGVK